MTEPLKFFKVDHTTIYHDGFSYTFHRDLDPPKSRPDQIQLQQSFHCAFKVEENCQSRCHVTGNWEMDKKGRKFMLGIVKKRDHTHGQEYRDTTPKLRFYKSDDDESVHRNGFDYSLYRYLDPPKQIGDFEWNPVYRCSMSGQENCPARIYTTGQWEEKKRGEKYQWGTFKNCFHSHGLVQDSNEEDNQNENNIVAGASSSTHTKDLGKIKRKKDKQNKDENNIAASTYSSLKDIDKKERIRFYKYKQASVQWNGFIYSNPQDLKIHLKWKCRMYCQRQINKKKTCNGYIWTTGKWQKDDCKREYQIGIVMSQHDHEPYQMAMQGKDNDDEAEESGLKFYQYKVTCVHRDGFAYRFIKKLKSVPPPWRNRMLCTRHTTLSCYGAIWTTGEWETDSLGRNYQRGIPRGQHCHKAYPQFLNEDDTAHVGDGSHMDDKQSSDENDVVMVED